MKLGSVNAHYIKLTDDAKLAALTAPFIAKKLERELSASEVALLTRAMPDLKPRAQTLVEIADMAAFYFHKGAMTLDEKAQKLMTPEAKEHLAALSIKLKDIVDFTAENVEGLFRTYAEEKGLKLGAVAQPLRAALSGSSVSPPIFGVAALLGKEETLKRLVG